MPSRQYLWQLKKIAEGKCANCGKRRGQDPRLCNTCLAKKNASHRVYAREHVRKRSRARVADERCSVCNEPLQHYKWLCDHCQIRSRILRRNRYAKSEKTASHRVYARDYVLKRSRARVADGRCSICNEPLQHYKWLCDRCQIRYRILDRNRNGSKPWTGWGRKPLIPE